MGKNLSYTAVGLDRVHHRRRDNAWIAGRLADEKTRIVPVWRDRSLISPGAATIEGTPGDTPEAVLLSGKQGQVLLAEADHVTLLGLDGDIAYFAADISQADETARDALAGAGEFHDLRRVSALMVGPEAALLAYARGLMHWHRRHVFCGLCGNPTESHDGGHLRRCTNAGDPHNHFPRTDPAVIMLVSHDNPHGNGPACLLGRQSRWAEGMYSTLAGFVEPGETLEEAVAREVLEESGVRVTNVEYKASQPWPFPSSLMLGFRVRAETTKIKIDDREIEDAQWFRPEEVRSFGEWCAAPSGGAPGGVSPVLGKAGGAHAPAGEKRLPRKDSISRWLIEGWLEDVGCGK